MTSLSEVPRQPLWVRGHTLCSGDMGTSHHVQLSSERKRVLIPCDGGVGIGIEC
jgi:hypothetical protein